MKKHIALGFVLLAFLLNSCTSGLTPASLSATDFAQKIKELPNAPIVDVRTAEEYAKGHLLNAKNIDWNKNNFDAQIALLDKSKPVLVYCLSGGRSASAVKQLNSLGFKQVYELNGGIMKWRGANLPETTELTAISIGMTTQQFDQLLNTDKLVLIDFYADWCGPCKKMKPYLDEISRDMANKVTVIRINADDNQAIAKDLKIDALPVLQLYQDKTLVWANTGFIEKAAVIKQINKPHDL